MLDLNKISVDEIPLILLLAQEIWPENYALILSPAQISYMMDLMYSQDTIEQQMLGGVEFFLISLQEFNIGYLALEKEHKFKNDLYIHKIYLLPRHQGKGLGKKVMQQIFKKANQQNLSSLSLNVNRFNTARLFYEKMGFTIKYQEDIDIGQGYLMEDYVMQKTL